MPGPRCAWSRGGAWSWGVPGSRGVPGPGGGGCLVPGGLPGPRGCLVLGGWVRSWGVHGGDPPRLLLRAVRILLECILVTWVFHNSRLIRRIQEKIFANKKAFQYVVYRPLLWFGPIMSLPVWSYVLYGGYDVAVCLVPCSLWWLWCQCNFSFEIP